MTDAPVLLWFRRDLRVADNPALLAAVASERPIVAAFVLDDETPGPWSHGGAGRWWLHHSLAALARDLAAGRTRALAYITGRTPETELDGAASPGLNPRATS